MRINAVVATGVFVLMTIFGASFGIAVIVKAIVGPLGLGASLGGALGFESAFSSGETGDALGAGVCGVVARLAGVALFVFSGGMLKRRTQP
ncbi:MAG: hypothetical protein JO024_03375 [Candidatus Eremiobacteraeota bacterium]|nr:hypothetical protein [Candidatus Eremiobacteraeota bacterium]